MLIYAALLGGLITFYLINAVIGGLRYRSPSRIRISFATPADHELDYEDVTISSRDGTSLAGWYIPSRNRAAVILLHGYSGNRLGVMSHSVVLAKAGFGVLLLDLRAHGHSGGSGTFARGENTIADVRAAVGYILQRPDVDPARVGICGVSVGGTIALQATANVGNLRAVLTDGAGVAAYEDLLPPGSLFERLFLPFNKLFFSITARSVPTPPMKPNKEIVRKISPCPVLFIATGRGGEYRLNQRFYDAALEPKELWQIADAHHAGGWVKHPDDYFQKMVAFFSAKLLQLPG